MGGFAKNTRNFIRLGQNWQKIVVDNPARLWYQILVVTVNNGFPYVEACMGSIHNHNFSIPPALKKRVLINSYGSI
jgi:hypothetical protein